MPEAVEQEILRLNQSLLESIAAGDWAAYEKMCDPSLTALEPEARGQLVIGMPFHKFYFDVGVASGLRNTTMCAPHVRVVGDVAVIAYVRLTQRVGSDGKLSTSAIEESRVWQRKAGRWWLVHLHRSVPQ
jgi:calcium/calmodulin-dependent protein kinase (CaM kinase) II